MSKGTKSQDTEITNIKIANKSYLICTLIGLNILIKR